MSPMSSANRECRPKWHFEGKCDPGLLFVATEKWASAHPTCSVSVTVRALGIQSSICRGPSEFLVNWPFKGRVHLGSDLAGPPWYKGVTINSTPSFAVIVGGVSSDSQERQSIEDG
jgi:hypothetical protein